MKHPLSRQRAKIGLYTVGLQAYWDQFPGLRERLLHYGGFIAKKLEETCDVCYFGLVDDPASGRAAGEYFAQKGVDLLFLTPAPTAPRLLPCPSTRPAARRW